MAKKNIPTDPVLAAIANIEKQMGGNPEKPRLIRYGDESERVPPKDVLSFGLPDVDSASFCGGIPRGKIVELFGEESSGKSYLSLKLIAEAQKKGLVCVLFDAEQSFDISWASLNGVDVDKLIIFSDSMTAEKQLEYVYQTCKSGAFALIVFDSTAALLPKAALEGSIEDKHVAELARVMSQALPKILNACAETNTTCVFINQIREKIGIMFGNNETTPGGRALKFYSHQRLRVSHGGSIKIEEDGTTQIVGKKSYVTFVKNKTARPYGKAEICIMWDEMALNPVVALCREAKKYGVIKKYKGELKLNKDVLGTDGLAPMNGAITYADAAHFLVVNGYVDTVAEMTLEMWKDDPSDEPLEPIVEEILKDPTIVVSPVDSSKPPVKKDLVEDARQESEDEGEESVT